MLTSHRMTSDTNRTLEELARSAAVQWAGEDAVEQVAVEDSWDLEDRPAYLFSFVIDETRAHNNMGLVRIRIRQTLRDMLEARGDSHLPMIRMLGREGWERRMHAVSG